jgi:leucyl-tRNA synthetase
MWEKLGHKPSVATAGWPTVDPKLLTQDEVEVVIQINGKIKERLNVTPDISNSELEAKAKAAPEVAAALVGVTIKKTIVVPAKLVNFVI